jgi:transposase-like protein
VAQHFLLSTKARTLSLAQVLRLSDDEAFEHFRAIRWTASNGEPVCPKCGSLSHYFLKNRRMWRCKEKECGWQFSVTSDTIFAGRKLALRDILAAIAIFVNGAKGHSALQLSRDLDVQYKTAFVLSHKIREVMAADVQDEEISGDVEVDGAYFGGYIKPANKKENRRDFRLLQNQNGKRRVVVIMRERNGTTLPTVYKSEAEGVAKIAATVQPGSTIYADEASHWDMLHARFDTKRINHSQAYKDDDCSTNFAESFFSRLRRAEIGTHHKIAGPYLHQYANEMAWREDHRRISNGQQYWTVATQALNHPVSRQWKGYWQRRTIHAAE